ncbi:MAG: PaaI family thioesterase [Dermatophilaceae bacterium]
MTSEPAEARAGAPDRVDDHLALLHRIYAASPVNDHFRPRLDVVHASATVEIDVRHDLTHTAGGLHAAVVIKAMDDAAFFAAQSLEREFFLATADLTTHLLRPVASGTLRAAGVVLSAGSRVTVTRVEATVGDRTVAHLVASLMATRHRLRDLA